MGQYYRGFLVKNNEVFGTISPSDYGEGLKLLEHSYLGSNTVKVLMSSLFNNNELRIAWLGDYFDEQKDGGVNKIPYTEKEIEIFLENSDKTISVSHELEEALYIVNHTKKLFIDLAKLNSCNFYIFEKSEEDCLNGYIFNPLPFLTSYAGDGSGDYRDIFVNHKRIGEWAFDVIGTYKEMSFDDYVEFEYEERKRP